MKKVKKYLIPGLIFISVFLVLVIPALSLADNPTLAALNISTTSVTLSSTGLIPNQIYKFKFDLLVGTLESQVTADAAGNASSFFQKLNPSEDFTVNLVKYDPITGLQTSSGAPTLKFRTLDDNSSGAFGYYGSITTTTPISTSSPVTSSTPASASTPVTNSVSTPTPASSPVTNLSSTPATTSGGLISCNNTPDASGKIAQPCDFNALLTLINTVIHFILFDMVIPIAAIMFAYAGFLMVTAGGEAAHARTKAKDIFTKAVIGLVIAVAAWVIVKTILSILGWNGAWIGF
jgi:hypothetical protein